jgi:hypothetical protein
MLINQKYRINMVLDNLPVTAQDLLDKVSSLHTAAAARCSHDEAAAAAAADAGSGARLEGPAWTLYC